MSDYLPSIKPYIMSKILIPVDFSLASHNAYAYGLKLAETLGLNVHLVPYYSGSINPQEELVFTGDGSIHGSFQTRLEQFAFPAGEGFDYPLAEPPKSVTVTCEVDVAFPVASAIKKRAEQDDVELVVMATRTGNAVLEKWLGSTSAVVSESCNCPIFLIPPNASYERIDNIVVANHHETSEAFPFWQIEVLSEFTQAKVHFVNVEHTNLGRKTEFVPGKLIAELTQSDPNWKERYEVVAVKENSISKGLIHYADQVDADLVVIVNQLRSYWK
jgi:nucleotide-binding universal stress UspA family protein